MRGKYSRLDNENNPTVTTEPKTDNQRRKCKKCKGEALLHKDICIDCAYVSSFEQSKKQTKPNRTIKVLEGLKEFIINEAWETTVTVVEDIWDSNNPSEYEQDVDVVSVKCLMTELDRLIKIEETK